MALRLSVMAPAQIEYAFDSLAKVQLGKRGFSWDASTWDHGNPKQIGKALIEASNHLESRVKNMTFPPSAQGNGGPQARLGGAIATLRRVGQDLCKDRKTERNDYHWEIVGALINTVAVLLTELNV